jgi:hypothetical protein
LARYLAMNICGPHRKHLLYLVLLLRARISGVA